MPKSLERLHLNKFIGKQIVEVTQVDHQAPTVPNLRDEKATRNPSGRVGLFPMAFS